MKKTYTIHFNNGKTREITEKELETITNKLEQGCSQFQFFSNEKDRVYLLINLSEITLIE